MRHTIKNLIALLTIAVFLLAACQPGNVPEAPTPLAGPDTTQIAATVLAGVTQTAQALPPVPSNTPALPAATDTAAAPTDTVAVPTDTVPAASDTPAPSETPETAATQVFPTAVENRILIFEDDFSSGVGWAEQQDDRFGFGFEGQAYQIFVNFRGDAVWSIRDVDYEDVSLEVDARLTSGPENGYFGLVCRHVDEDNYYALMISADGTYGIAKKEDGEFDWLKEGTAPEDVIEGGDAVNRIRVDCLGDTLSLFANGQKLDSVEDDDFTSGVIGMAAGARDRDGVEVLFDNFEAYRFGR